MQARAQRDALVRGLAEQRLIGSMLELGGNGRRRRQRRRRMRWDVEDYRHAFLPTHIVPAPKRL
jgi:hypothetical protein